MQVMVVVIDNNGKSDTFQLERVRETPNYVLFSAGDRGNPLICRTYIAKNFKATKKN